MDGSRSPANAAALEAPPPSATVAPYPPPSLSWFVWGVAAFFYLAGFYLRVSPAVMTTELMRAFHINAGALGNFSAVYFYTYVLMQIPTGVLVDSWGARRLLVLGALFAAIGTFVFGATSSYAIASTGRALVGAATAIGWVVTLKLATHWLPAPKFAMVAGLGLLMGNIGALVAQVPLRLLVEQVGWRAAVMISGLVILLVGVVAAIGVQNDPSARGYHTYAPPSLRASAQTSVWQLLRGFGTIFRYRNTWLIFFAQGAFVGSVLAFTGLWGPTYLRARYALPAKSAAAVCSVMIVCWAVASPIFGYLSDRIRRRRPLYLAGAVAAAVGWSILFYFPILPLAAFVVVAAITSFACGAVIIGFPFAKESVPVRFLGTVSGAVNVGNMIGPTLLQPAIGWILDRHWTGETISGLRVYGPGAFRAGFVLVIAWSALSCLLIAFTRETRCGQTP